MLILGIETTTEKGSVALARDGCVLARRVFTHSLGHSEKLVPALDTVFKAARARARDLDAIAVGVGPGSYTGMRVGIAAAYGLACLEKIPVVGVPSLDAMVLANQKKIPKTVASLYAVVDAKRNETYVGEYRRCNGNFIRRRKIRIVPNSQIQKWLAEGIFLCGAAKISSAERRAPNDFFPTASSVAVLGGQQLQKGKPKLPPKPIYIRPFISVKSEEQRWTRFAARGLKLTSPR